MKMKSEKILSDLQVHMNIFKIFSKNFENNYKQNNIMIRKFVC